MRHPGSQKLFEYWNTLRGSRAAPERSEIEPSDIRSVLGDTFILEVSQHFRTVSFRLAGTRLCAAYGRELKGLGFMALWREEDNYEVARTISNVYRDNIPMLFSYTALTANEKSLEYEAVILPLAMAADGNARVLGIATPRAGAYWLGNEALVANSLKSTRRIVVLEAAAKIADPVSSQPGLRRFGHLTVVDGGKSRETTTRQ